MPKDNIQHRGKKPRVHITCDVELGGAIENKEIPFRMGVIADLSGNHPDNKKAGLEDARFIDIDRHNFDDVMKGIAPKVQVAVPNRLREGDKPMGMELGFNSMDDFLPHRIAEKVPELKKLMEVRAQLSNLRTSATSNREFAGLLEKVVERTREVMEKKAN